MVFAYESQLSTIMIDGCHGEGTVKEKWLKWSLKSVPGHLLK
jgi:hypothetical protein